MSCGENSRRAKINICDMAEGLTLKGHLMRYEHWIIFQVIKRVFKVGMLKRRIVWWLNTCWDSIAHLQCMVEPVWNEVSLEGR